MMESVVKKLRAAIGLDVASIGIGAIERAVQQRLAATHLTSTDRYSQFLQGSPEEMRALIDAIVVPETWFFRDRGAFSAVACEARRPGSFRYLCVPCATGEEPLSLAMTLLDAGLAPERFHIDAFDICERLVIHAARGMYGRNSFRGQDVAFRARYFQETPEGCSIHPAVRRQINFQQANLLDEHTLPGAQLYDAIFCRNLLIYFDAAAQARALKKIARLLREDGMLCVAPAETGLLLRHGFVPADMPQAFAFRAGQRPAASPLPKPKPPVKHIAAPVAHKRPQPAPPPRPVEQIPAVPKPELADAMRLANEGHFDEVSKICRAYIETRGASADVYYLLALVSDASARHEEAAALYRKALYLNPQHREALAHFSLLSDKLGHTAAAGALRQRALRIESDAA